MHHHSITSHTCPQCGQTYTPNPKEHPLRRSQQRFCSVQCSQKGSKKKAPASKRFWGKVLASSLFECWLWTAGRDRHGYGQFALTINPTKMITAHRYAYETLVGVVPSGNDLHHICNIRTCVNPIHLTALKHSDHGRVHRKPGI